MRAWTLPLAIFIGFLLVIGAMHANAIDNGIDDEKIEKMLRNILNNTDLPVPSSFVNNITEIRGYQYVYDYGGSHYDEFEAYQTITKQNGRCRVNGTYEYFGDIFETYYTFGQRVKAYLKIYLDNLEPSGGCRYTFNHDVNETKKEYDVEEESKNRLLAYSINIGDWDGEYYRGIDRDYKIYCLNYFSMGEYEVYVKVYVEIDMETSSIKKETEYEKNMVYDINPDALIPNELECLNIYSFFGDDLTNRVKSSLQKLINETGNGEEQQEEEQQEEQKNYTAGNVAILYEYDFDKNGNGKVVGWGNVLEPHPYPFYNISVEAFGQTYYPHVHFYTGKIRMDELFNTSLILFDGETFTIRLKVTTDDSYYKERCKTDELLPMEAKIKCYVEIDDMDKITKVTIKEARNCWIDTGNGWEVLYENGKWKEVDATNGFKIKVRSVPAWEKLVKYSIYRFLNESNFYTIVSKANNFNFAKINDIPIYYGMGSNAEYDPNKDAVNLRFLPGNTYMYNSDFFDTIFHEFGHAIKWHVYRYVDNDVEDYLGGGHETTCDETNVYFAFEEGHSEFFASLMLDYVKEKKLIDDAFLTSTDYYTTPCHFGKEGDKVEGAVAGLLLNGLYRYYTEYEYNNAQTKAYELFAKACELCNKYLKHYPYSIHDVLPFIITVEPASERSLSYYDIIEGYECGIALHGNANPMKTDGLYGYPLLIAVEPSWLTKVKATVNGVSYTIKEPNYGNGVISDDVSDGMACVIFIEKGTKIEADFSKRGGVYVILYDLNGSPMEEIVSMQYRLMGNAIIEFERNGIKIVQGRVVVKSNAGITYKAGDKIKITPHSEFVLDVENKTANIYVLDGNVEVGNGLSYREVKKKEKAVITGESIDVKRYKKNELNELWSNFGDAMATLGIEKEEGEKKQSGFEIIGIVIAIALPFIRRKWISMQ